MSPSVSLFKLESDLTELMEMRAEALTEGSMEAVALFDQSIADYCDAEVRKVDGIREVWRWLENVIMAAGIEIEFQQARKAAAKANLDRLKSNVQAVMESMQWREGKPRKLEGQTGALYLKANGGKQAVTITDEALVPDEYTVMEGRLPTFIWIEIRQFMRAQAALGDRVAQDISKDMEGCIGLKRVPSLSLIAEALGKPCPRCSGKKYVNVPDTWISGQTEDVQCSECGGTGLECVPGCRLEARGQHVEVK